MNDGEFGDLVRRRVVDVVEGIQVVVGDEYL